MHNMNMLWTASGFHAHLAAHRSQTVGKHGFEFSVRYLYSRVVLMPRLLCVLSSVLG